MERTALVTKPVEDLLDLFIKSLSLDLAYRVLPSPDPPSKASDFSPEIKFELSGPDAPLLTANDGELLHAIEHIAAKILNLDADQHDRISLDADGFKQKRDQRLHHAVHTAIGCVRQTGQPFVFPPMSSRERRMLHLLLQDSGLPTASSGEPPRRFVVLYPKAHAAAKRPLPAPPARAHNIRTAFRPR